MNTMLIMFLSVILIYSIVLSIGYIILLKKYNKHLNLNSNESCIKNLLEIFHLI